MARPYARESPEKPAPPEEPLVIAISSAVAKTRTVPKNSIRRLSHRLTDIDSQYACVHNNRRSKRERRDKRGTKRRGGGRRSPPQRERRQATKRPLPQIPAATALVSEADLVVAVDLGLVGTREGIPETKGANGRGAIDRLCGHKTTAANPARRGTVGWRSE